MPLTALRFFALALVVSSFLLGTACSNLAAPVAHQEPAKPTPPAAQPNNDADQNAENDTAPSAPFNAETMYSLLVGEIAGHRGRADVALNQYVKQAHITRDKKVIARANRIARYLGQPKETIDTALLWIEVEPNSIEARQVAAQHYLAQGQYADALQQMDALLNLSDDINLDALIKNGAKLKEADRQKLIQSLSTLRQKHPNNIQLLLAEGSLLELNRQEQAALVLFDKALQLKPDNIPAIIAKTRVLLKTKQTEAAKDLLGQAVEKHPDHLQLQLLYAQVLIQSGKTEQAEDQLKQLEQKNNGNEQLLLLIASLYMENNLSKQASSYLERLMDSEDFGNEAHFFQALIDEKNKQYDAALKHFNLVKPSKNFIEARIRIAHLLDKTNTLSAAVQSLENDRKNYPQLGPVFYLAQSELLCGRNQFQACYDLLNDALKAHPGNNEILYARAMAAEKNQRHDLMEQDLLTLINGNPNNTAALNALGYSLADRSQRLDEALTYITRAYSLEPNDAAITDSLGWVYYRQGKLAQALQYLKKAYELTPDPEIAAHLGEVLWMNGQREEAKTLWQDSLKKHPQSPYLQSVLKRFPL